MPRNFPNLIAAYADYTAASESPRTFHFWTAIATIAGALRRRVWWDERVFQWTPNFYIVLVAPAGVVSKSTSIDLGMHLLRQVPGIHFGPESNSWQALGEAMAEATEHMRWTPPGETEEQLVPMSPVTVPISELGTFLNTEDSKAMSFLTTMWDNRTIPFQHRTRTQSLIEIKNPWLNLIAATTPSWVRNNIPDHLIGDGLMSRIIFVFEEKKRQLVARPSKIIRSADFYDLQKKLIEDLTHIATEMKGCYDLTKEADDWYEAWYIKHNTQRPPHLSSDRFGGYIARKQGHLTKLAMILAAAQRDDLVIQKTDLELADELLLSTERSMLRVFDSIGNNEEARRVAELTAYVKAHGWLTSQDLYTQVRNIMSKRDFEEALKAAIYGGLLDIVKKNDKPGVSPRARTVN